MATKTRERTLSTSAPVSDLQGPIAPQGMSRPKHKRTVTGFGAQDIKSVEASIPEGQREACVCPNCRVCTMLTRLLQVEEACW